MADELETPLGLTESEVRLYGRCGLSAQEALAWKSRGIGPYWAEGFLRLGLSLEESELASDAGFGPNAVETALARGLTPRNLVDWSFLRGDGTRIEWALSRGLTADEMSEIARSLERLESLGATRAQCEKWFDDGKALDRIADELQSGLEPADVEREYPLIGAIESHSERERWRVAAKFIPAIAHPIEVGLSPTEAVWGCTEHDLSFVPPQLIVDAVKPYLRRVDGQALPIKLSRFESKRPSTKDLRLVGFEVEERDSRQEFIDEFPDAIVFGVTMDESDNVDQPVMIRLVPVSDGSWHVEECPWVRHPRVTTESSFPSALERVERLLDESEGEVITASSKNVSGAHVLSHLLDSGLPLARTVSINDQKAMTLQTETGHSVIPLSPRSWPDYCQLVGGAFALGDLVFTGSNPETTTFIGRFDSLGEEVLLPAIWLKQPALTVERRALGVEPAITQVWRRSPTSFEVESPDGQMRQVEATSVLELLRSAGSLSAFSTSQFTRYSLSPIEVISPVEMVSTLSWIEPPRPIEEVCSTFEADDALPVWAEALSDAPARDGICHLPVVVGGRFVAWLDSLDAETPMLVDIGDDIYCPEVGVVEEWARLSITEEASRTSGVDVWTLGLLPRSVVLESWFPDQDYDSWTAHLAPNHDRLDEIVDWLERVGWELNIDLVMLAVELVIGESLDYASMFTDDASDSLNCSMTLAIWDSEIETFLEKVCARGRSDCIDAIRAPNTEAYRRRLERIESHYSQWTT